jgi:DNA-directed RNA polymerase specialized sigma24 family protein
MSEFTRILSQIESGQAQAAEQLLPLVYDELRKLAAARLAREKPGQTLQATALVHEAYLRLIGDRRDRGPDTTDDANLPGNEEHSSVSAPLTPDSLPPAAVGFHSHSQFLLAAAMAMRRILIEHARARVALKRGGTRRRIDLDEAHPAAPERGDDLLALDEALQRLAAAEPLVAQLVQLRYFAGCTMTEAAGALNLSLRTAHRLWAYAKAFLLEELRPDEPA